MTLRLRPHGRLPQPASRGLPPASRLSVPPVAPAMRHCARPCRFSADIRPTPTPAPPAPRAGCWAQLGMTAAGRGLASPRIRGPALHRALGIPRPPSSVSPLLFLHRRNLFSSLTAVLEILALTCLPAEALPSYSTSLLAPNSQPTPTNLPLPTPIPTSSQAQRVRRCSSHLRLTATLQETDLAPTSF